MLIVKDLGVLPYYGFQKNGAQNEFGEDVWVKTERELGTDEEIELSLIVNPILRHFPGEMVACIDAEGVRAVDGFAFFEADFPLETVFQMIKDGAVELRKTSAKERVA